MPIISTPIRLLIFSIFSFASCRILLYYSYPEYFQELSTQQFFLALLKGVQFDSATMMSSTLLFIVLLTLPFAFIQQTRFRRFCLHAVSIILFLLLSYNLTDISYFGEVKRHIGSEILNISSDLGAVFSLALSSRLNDLVRGLLLFVFWGIVWYWFILRPEKKRPIQLPTHYGKRLLYWLITALLIVFSIRGFIPSGRPINIADAFTHNGSIAQANLSLNPAYLSFREIQKRLKQQALSLVSLKEVEVFAQTHPKVFSWQNSQAKPNGKNVVLILLESWNRRHIDSLSGTSYKVTPFFDSLIPKSQVWDNYYAAGQRSIIGIQAILSSVPALPSFGTIGFGLEIKNISRLGDILKENDYNSLMMQTSKRRSFQMENIAKALGFAEYYGQEDIPLLRDYPQEQPPFGWDYDGLQFFAQRLSQMPSDKPFFSFIFTGTTHEPFPRLPTEFELYAHDPRSESGFLNALRYSDWSLEQFFKRIQDEPWFNNTIFILTADHTLNTLRNQSNKDLNSDESLQSASLSSADFHIPLLIYTPDGSLTPRRIDSIASQYDILPTIIDLLGFSQKIHTFGQSLYDKKQSEQAYVFLGSEFGIITPKQTIFFNEINVKEQETQLSPENKAALDTLKLKLQYADELLRRNQWTD